MARGKTVYLRSESGRVEDFDQFRKKLSKLGTSETLRFREIRNLLKKELRPLMTKARQEAYKNSPKKGQMGTKKRGKGNYTSFYNLYKTINMFPNKGTVKAYVVLGLDSRGAYYSRWQLFGGARAGRRGKAYEMIKTKKGKASGYGLYRSHLNSGVVKRNGLPAKKFFDKALENKAVLTQAQKRITKFVQKRIKDTLR